MKQQVTTSHNKLPQVTPSFGFTLIELLVVIAIICLLAGMVGLVYTSARRSGRDSQRQADLKKIQNALEIFYSDHHQYPVPVPVVIPLPTFVYGAACQGLCGCTGETILPEVLCGGYIKELPVDPDGTYYYQALDLDGEGKPAECYCLSAKMEKLDTDGDGNPGEAAPGSCSHYGDYNYTLTCP